MARMTGGEALARQLVREGVKIVFGLPGVQLYGALAGLRDERVRLITTRHEHATTYLADRYASAPGPAAVASGETGATRSRPPPTARAASSSVAVGVPHTAPTASPMHSPTAPPSSPINRRHTSK